MSITYECIPHPTVEGAWTVTPYTNGLILIIVRKEYAEALAAQRNGLDVAKGVKSLP